MDNILKAKATLILDQPFFATLLLGMNLVEDNSIPTMATDGETIKYNKEFASKLSVSETVFVLGHEVMHAVFQHMHRRESRHPQKWNMAADYVINDLLINEKIGTPIQGILHNPILVQQGNGTAEGVYNLLPDHPKGNENLPKPGEQGGAMDGLESPSQDEATNSQKEAEMKVKVAQAAQAAKMSGKLSAGIERLVKEVVRSQTDWKAVLRKFFSERSKDEYTYAKPKRRFLADDIYLPGLNGESMGTMVIAVDYSGSISKHTAEIFGKEMKGIIEDVKPSDVTVVYFDSEVLHTDTFQRDEEFVLKYFEGGGTAFSPVFDHVEKLGIPVQACVFLTDLCCSDFGDDPGYPVLWCSTHSDQAPFGEVLKIKE